MDEFDDYMQAHALVVKKMADRALARLDGAREEKDTFTISFEGDALNYTAQISPTSGLSRPIPTDEEVALGAIEMLEMKIADLIAQLEDMSSEARLPAATRALSCLREADAMLSSLMEGAE